MALRVLEWLSKPGLTLPEPRLQDDSETIPRDIVRQVKQWLTLKEPEFKSQGATPQLLELSRTTAAKMSFLDTKGNLMSTEPQRASGVFMEFEAGTFQVLLRTKQRRTVLAHYDYLGARDTRTGAVVLGPLLRVTYPDGSLAR